MYKFLNLFLLLNFILILSAVGQTSKINKIVGRGIHIKLSPLKNCKVYLGTYRASYNSKILVDSTFLDNNSLGVFRGQHSYTPGIYFLVSPQMSILFEFLMDDVQSFDIVGDTLYKNKILVTGSIENDHYLQFNNFVNTTMEQRYKLESELKNAKTKTDSSLIMSGLQKNEVLISNYQDTFITKHNSSILATLFKAIKRPKQPAIPFINGKPDSLYPYRYVKEHYWDDVNFNDDRLYYTPFFDSKLTEYFKYYVSPDPDSIIAEINYILLYARNGKEMYPYLLTKFTNKYINPEFMGQDKVFLYLFEHFYAKGDTILLNQTSKNTITERAYSLMANQLGQKAPPLILTDTTGKTVSLYAIDAPLTIIAFWDPNCGHCKEEIPKLDLLYKDKWETLGVKVLSVNIYENEIQSWKRFINDKKLSHNWIHAYETKEAKEITIKAGQANYRQLYDIFKTPTLYLLDKDKRIIAKQLSLEQFSEIISAKLKIITPRSIN